MSKKKVKNTITTTTVTVTTTSTVDNSNKEQYDFFVLDRSGSMSSIRDVTISGFNEYLQKAIDTEKQTGIKSYCSVLLFDYGATYADGFIDLCSFAPLSQVPKLTTENYVPRGNTALNDAVARAINALRARLGSRAASDDVDVTITVFTDGQENASKEYASPAAIKALVEDAKNNLKWTIAYIGAGSQQQIQYAAQNIGINISNVANYTNDTLGTTTMFRGLTEARSAKSFAYSSGLKCNSGYMAPDPEAKKKGTPDITITGKTS